MQVLEIFFPQELNQTHSIEIEGVLYINKLHTPTDSLIKFVFLQEINE
jgi:hypothetical protein